MDYLVISLLTISVFSFIASSFSVIILLRQSELIARNSNSIKALKEQNDQNKSVLINVFSKISERTEESLLKKEIREFEAEQLLKEIERLAKTG